MILGGVKRSFDFALNHHVWIWSLSENMHRNLRWVTDKDLATIFDMRNQQHIDVPNKNFFMRA